MRNNKTKRKSIPKGIRFDVLKRDSFTCQYCGAEAPKVLLHIDHKIPVSKGGKNDLVNLLTSCQACNLGKSNKLLDGAFLSRSKTNSEIRKARKEQREMFSAWKQGLGDIAKDTFWRSLNRRSWSWRRTRRIEWVLPLIKGIVRLVQRRNDDKTSK